MPGTYDPNCEATNEEKLVAGCWELLRRNKELRALLTETEAAKWFAAMPRQKPDNLMSVPNAAAA